MAEIVLDILWKMRNVLGLWSVLVQPEVVERHAGGRGVCAWRQSHLDSVSPSIIVEVAGMSCQKCDQTVREALLSFVGVTNAADLRTGLVVVRVDPTDEASLRQTIRQQGFNVDE